MPCKSAPCRNVLDSFALPCQIRHTRRRGSIAIKVSASAVHILAPRNTPLRAIHQLISQRRTWIEEAIAAQATQPARSYVSGEQLWFDGALRVLRTDPAAEPGLTIEPGQLLLRLPASADREQRRHALLEEFQQQAQGRWPPLVAEWAARIGVEVEGVKIRPYKSRWGACTASGKISLNTLLIMAPPMVQQYVIIHELCHRIHLNHSPAFWALVAQWSPDHITLRRWLKRHSAELRLD